MRCATWSNPKAKTAPERRDEPIAGDDERKPTVRQRVLDFLHLLFTFGALLGAVYYRAVFGG